MKYLMIALFLLSLASFAGVSCYEKIEADYRAFNIARDYEFDYVSKRAVVSIEKAKEIYETFDTELSGDEYEVYVGVSEYMSGYGEDALVVKKATCETVEVVEIYAE